MSRHVGKARHAQRRAGLAEDSSKLNGLAATYLGRGACGQTSLQPRYLGTPVGLGDWKIGWGGGAES